MAMMNAAVVTSFDEPPHYQPFEVPQPAGDGEILVDVLAVGLHPRVRTGAAGAHYTSRRTLPIVVGRRPALVVAAGVGLLFIPASLLLPRNAGYGGAYFLIALLAQMAVLIAATWMLLGRVERVSALLKAAMVIGLAALVAGKVA